jgi:hypothetical protein
MSCKCKKLEKEINSKFKNTNWNNCSEACATWCSESQKLKDNKIKWQESWDKGACRCPTCGRELCSWCV